MAVEIRELVIKTTIDNSGKKGGKQKSRKNEEQGDLVRKCVDQVMELLDQQKGR